MSNRPMFFNRIKQGVSYVENLIASYKFENNLADYKGNHNGSQVGTLSFVSGKVGQGLNIDRNGEYLSIPDSDDFSFTDGTSDLPFSICFWMNPDNLNIFSVIIGKRNGSTSNREYEVFINTSAVIGLQLLSPTNSPDNRLNINSPSGFSIGTWYHVVFTYDGSETQEGLSMYIDGVSTGTKSQTNTYSGMINTSSPLSIGTAIYSTGLGVDGQLDEIKIYKNRVLTQEEVTEMYNLEKIGTNVLP